MVRWLILAAALAQAGVPLAPRNLRILDGNASCGSGLIGIPPNCFPAPPGPVAPGKQWQLIYSEEFSGSSLNLTKLSPCFDWNYGACTASFNTGKERYLPSQVQVANGTAKLVAEPLTPPYASSACYQGQCTYKAGLVSTARPRADNGSPYLFPFTYGYVESRMKFPGTPGFFTAFWMLPTNPELHLQHRNRHRRDPGRPSRHDLHDVSLQRSQQLLHTQQRPAQQRRVPGEGLLHRFRAIWRRLAADLHRLVHRRREVRPVQRQLDARSRPARCN